MITVITDDARYDFEADNWTVNGDELDVWKTDNLHVATFMRPAWQGVFATRQLVPEPAAS